MECTSLMRAVRRNNLDTLGIPSWPLDVLAQQIVAACSSEEWDEDELFRLIQRAYPYRELTRQKFDQVVEMLSKGVAPRGGRTGAYLHRDGVNGKLRGRRGARLAALTSGGAIPDNTDYDVIADPEAVFVGTVNEDFAIESMAGDVFLLGNTPWKIRRVESGRVRVEDASGNAPTIPFWLGEAPGRTRELADEISDLRFELDQRLDRPEEAKEWLVEATGVVELAARQVVDYLIEGKRVLGTVPTARRIIAERFLRRERRHTGRDPTRPLGARVNRAWGMALRKQICRSTDFELQAAGHRRRDKLLPGPNTVIPIERGVSASILKNGGAYTDPGGPACASFPDQVALELDQGAGDTQAQRRAQSAAPAAADARG